MGDRSAESGWFLPGPKNQERIDRKWKSIIPVLDVMYTWGMDYLNGLNVKTPCQKQERV